jgi:succinoglycan biosynthesis transport protein ExoP
MMAVVFYAIYLVFFFIPLYGSFAKVLIRNLPQSPVITSYGSDALVKSESGYSNPLFNYMQILQSNRLALAVYEPLKAKYSKDLEALAINNQSDWVEKYGKLLLAKVEPSTDVIKVDFLWNNKAHSSEVLNLLLDAFRQTNMDIRLSSQRVRTGHMDEQLKKIGQDLDAVRQKIKQYRVNNRTIDLESEAAELTRVRIELFKQNQLLKAQAQFDETRKLDLARQLGYSSGNIALKATGIGGDPYLVKLSQDLAQVEQRYAKLTTKLTGEHPDVKEAANEITSLQAHIQERETKIIRDVKLPNAAYDETSRAVVTDLVRAQADQIAHRSELRMIENAIQEIVKRENSIPAKKQGLDELTKTEQSLAIAYASTKEKDLEARIQQSQVDDNIVILSLPSKARLIPTDALLKAILMLFVGALGGYSIGWMKDFIEDRWKDVNDIEVSTGQTVLGTLPWVSEKLFNVTREKGELLSPELRTAYAQVSNQLLLSSYRENAQIITLLSSRLGRLDSSVGYNLCITLCRLGKSVVFINTLDNLKRLYPFKLTELDLVDIVTEINATIRKNDVIATDALDDLLEVSSHKVDIDNNPLICFSIDKPGIHLHDVVGSKGFEFLLGELKKRYEFIIIDTPDKPIHDPALQSLVFLGDASVIIMSQERNRKGLLNLVQQLRKHDKSILGVISRFKAL